MSKRPVSVTINFIFILLNALIWLALGVIIAANAHPALRVSPIIKGTMALLSFGAAGILVGLFCLLRKRIRIAWFITLGFLAIISILSIFDEFGWIDLIVLGINLIPIILLIRDRAWYLHGMAAEAET